LPSPIKPIAIGTPFNTQFPKNKVSFPCLRTIDSKDRC
jgi:hypothetical protein